MPRFYFDHYGRQGSIIDEVGLEFATPEQARDCATRTLGELARDALPRGPRRELAIDVSDENRSLLFRATLWFEVHGVG